MQGKEIIILQSRIAALEQYNKHLLERNELLNGLVKKYIKFLKEFQSKEEEKEHEKIY